MWSSCVGVLREWTKPIPDLDIIQCLASYRSLFYIQYLTSFPPRYKCQYWIYFGWINMSEQRLATGSDKGLSVAKTKFLTNGSKQFEVQKRSKTGNLAKFSHDASLHWSEDLSMCSLSRSSLIQPAGSIYACACVFMGTGERERKRRG